MKSVLMASYYSVLPPKLSHSLSVISSFNAMTIVEQIVPAADIESRYAGYGRETLTLNWEQRRQGHGRRTSDAGLEFAISLPAGTVLKGGDLMILEAEQ